MFEKYASSEQINFLKQLQFSWSGNLSRLGTYAEFKHGVFW